MKRLAFSCLLLACVAATHAAALRDPTQPPTFVNQESGKDDISNIQVLSAMASPHRQNANINGEVLKIGDKVGKYQIINITADYVEFAQGKKRVKVYIFNNSLRQTNS